MRKCNENQRPSGIVEIIGSSPSRNTLAYKIWHHKYMRLYYQKYCEEMRAQQQGYYNRYLSAEVKKQELNKARKVR